MNTLHIVVVIVIAVLAFFLWRLQRDPNNDFNLFDLLMDNGRLSRIACVFLAAFGVYSYVIIKLVLTDEMTEGYMTAYGLTFVAPIIAKLFSPTSSPAPPKGNDGTTLNP